MGRVAPRKRASLLRVRKKQHDGNADGGDSPSKQLASEAAMGRQVSQEEPREHVLSTFTGHLDESQERQARDKESTSILQRAAQKGRRASKKLIPPVTVERPSPRKRKPEPEVYDLSDDEEEVGGGGEEKDERDSEPATPMVTRSAARSTASPEQKRSAKKVVAVTKSPKAQRKATKWSKRDDERLLHWIVKGAPIAEINDDLDTRTTTEIEERMVHLDDLRQKERAEQEEAEAAGQQDFDEDDGANGVVEKGDPWSLKDVALLLELWDDGFVPEVLRERFPGRSWEAIQSRYYKANNARKKGKRIAPEQNESPPKRPRLEPPPEIAKQTFSVKAAAPKSSAKSAEPSSSTNAPTGRGRGRPPKITGSPAVVPDPEPVVADARAKRGRGASITNRAGKESAAKASTKAPTESTGRTSASQRGSRKGKEPLGVPEPGTADGPIGVVSDVEEDADDQDDEVDYEKDGKKNEGEDENSHSDQKLWEAEVEEEDEEGRIITIPAELDLWGQRDALNKILQAALDHENQHFELEFSKRSKNEDPPIKAIKYNKDKLVSLLHELPAAEEFDEHRGKIDGALHKLRGQVRNLDIDKIKDDPAKKRFYRQVCIFITSDLLSILKAAIQAHATIEADDEEYKLWELTLLKTVTGTQVDLYNRTLKWKYTFAGIRKIKQDMLVPLRKVSEILERTWRRVSQARDAAFRHQNALTASQSRQHKEDRARRLRHDYDDKYDRLRALFLWRSAAANVRTPVLTKFRMSFKNQAEWEADMRVDDDEEMELDSDGLPIERVPLFGHRRPGSRPPRLNRLSLADQEHEEWTRPEMVALVDGLRILHVGEKLFKQLIDRYCRTDGALRQRTLPELLRKTAELVDVHARAVEQADVDDVEEAKAKWPDFLRDVPDLDLIELLW